VTLPWLEKMNTTSILKRRNLIVGISFAFAFQLHAQHSPAGSEGIKCGTLPATGFHVEDDNSFYYADQMQGFEGALNHGFNSFTYTQIPRLAWMTGWKVFGAEYGMAVRVPFIYKQTTGIFPHPLGTPSQSTTKSQFGISDVEVNPVKLGWQFKRFDINVGYSFFAPSGDYNKNQLFLYNLGEGYWTHSFALGATWYLDNEKTWAISLLNHYDINTAQYSSLVSVPVSPSHPLGIASEDTTLGDIYTLEWAISKTVVEGVDVGITGYYQQQVTDTEGPTISGPTWKNEKIHVAGIGPEIRGEYAKWGLSGSLRYAYDFSSMDHPQGHFITLTLTKSF